MDKRDSDKPYPLIFDWKKKRNFGLTALFFFLIAVSLHVAAFYLFNVKKPSDSRITPTPESITVYTPESPESRAFLQSIEDRTATLQFRARDPGTVKFSDHVSYFVPSFRNYEPRLKSPESDQTVAPPKLPNAIATGIVFPKMVIPKLPPMSPPVAAPPRPWWSFSGGLEEREITEQPEWKIEDDRFDSKRFRLHVMVGLNGGIAHCFMTEGVDNELNGIIVEKVRELQLVPLPEEENREQWGWISIQF